MLIRKTTYTLKTRPRLVPLGACLVVHRHTEGSVVISLPEHYLRAGGVRLDGWRYT